MVAQPEVFALVFVVAGLSLEAVSVVAGLSPEVVVVGAELSPEAVVLVVEPEVSDTNAKKIVPKRNFFILLPPSPAF